MSDKKTVDEIVYQPPLRRAAIGAFRGVKVAAALFVISFAAWALTGGRLFASRGFTIVGIAAMYFGWGLFGGAFGGLSSPLARGSRSSMIVAALVFTPLGVAVRVMDVGWFAWSLRDILTIAIGASIMGIIWGPLGWRAVHTDN